MSRERKKHPPKWVLRGLSGMYLSMLTDGSMSGHKEAKYGMKFPSQFAAKRFAQLKHWNATPEQLHGATDEKIRKERP